MPDHGQVDLDNCDREPIHLLGGIQPFGALLAVDAQWRVARYSANAEKVLGTDAAIEQGLPLGDIFGPSAVDTLRDTLVGAAGDDEVQRLFGLALGNEGNLFDIALHRSGSFTVIEVEPHDLQGFNSHVGSLRSLTADLEQVSAVQDLCEEAATRLKRMLGFDRVMVYRFHDDLSGEVIAEAREERLEAFLGLRYPKTDIPAQARALYLRNPFRIISDISAEAVPILPEGNGTEPLDLSLSTLRSVSPIHIEYLRNMGVDASLSISIIAEGKLWGLFACHHYSPRVLPFSKRTVAELFSQYFSLIVTRTIAEEESRLADKGREVHDQLMARLASGAALDEDPGAVDAVIRDLVPSDGCSVLIDGRYHPLGEAPDEKQFQALLPFLRNLSTRQIFATSSLAEDVPEADSLGDKAAGALVVPVSRQPQDYFVLWRKELPQVVQWAGNPEKPVETGPHGDRLTPRKSFEAWQQSVIGTSAPWTKAQLRIAESLRVTLIEVILRITDDTIRERERAQEQQELLIAELNHRVRNILNLIRSLISQSRHEASDVTEFSGLIGGRISALAAAHDHITKQNWSAAPLSELIRTEAEAYAARGSDRLVLKGPEIHIAPEAFTVIALVIHEMMTNSAKYGSLSQAGGRVTVEITRDGDGNAALHWAESGGPTVVTPTRRGFGSTIIEKSIPFDLKGKAALRFEAGGLEADFLIPLRFISDAEEGTDMGADGSPGTDAQREGSVPAHVLVVEDNLIIAMDVEDSLRELGVKTVTLASDVAEALTLVRDNPPDLAILDYSLGTETSEAVACELNQSGIPYYLASGYGDLPGESEFRPEATLMKPYGKPELADLFAAPAE